MWRKLIIRVFALLLLALTSLPVVISGPLALAHPNTRVLPIPTTTLDPTQILSTVNAVATQAADTAARNDSTLSVLDSNASTLNDVLVFFSFVAALLGLFGILTVAQLNAKIKEVNAAKRSVDAATVKVRKLVGETNATMMTAVSEVQDQAKSDVKQVIDRIPPRIEELRQEVTYLLRGYQLLEQKRKDQAKAAFQMALVWRPGSAQANYALGRVLSGDKLYKRAIECFREALKTEPDFSQAQMELGLTLRRQTDRIFEETTSGRTKEEMGQAWNRAVKQRNDGYFEAIQLLKKAEEALPGDEDILGALGGIYRRQGDYQTALVYYQSALDANPDSSYALGNVASLSYHLGMRQKATEAFERTFELAAKRIEARSSREPWWDYYDYGMAKLVLMQIGEDGNKEKYKTYEQDYDEAIERTLGSENFESVLNGLYFLREAQSKYDPPKMDGLDEIIAKVEKAKVDMEAKEKQLREAKEKVGEPPPAVPPTAPPAQATSASSPVSITQTEAQTPKSDSAL